MNLKTSSLLTAWLALPVLGLNHGIKEYPARATSAAELAEKSVNGVSPVPTSRPELAGIELFKRADYTLPSGFCGWYGDYSSAPYTCNQLHASCINVGNYRGCCSGSSASCASTFYTTCIPRRSLTSSQSCGTLTACCSNTDFPECVTMLFSSSVNTARTFTDIGCFPGGWSSTYEMQDFPPYLTITSTSTGPTTTTTTSSAPPSATTSNAVTTTPTTSTTPVPEPGSRRSSTAVGPIVGGVVGGVAVLGLISLGIFFLIRRNRRSADPSAASQQPPPGPGSSTFPSPGPQMAQTQQYSTPTSPGGSTMPGYDPRYAYAPPPGVAAGMYNQSVSPDSNNNVGGMGGGWGQQQGYYSPSPDMLKVDGSPSPVHVVVNEAPATNPRGFGDNRAELA